MPLVHVKRFLTSLSIYSFELVGSIIYYWSIYLYEFCCVFYGNTLFSQLGLYLEVVNDY